MTFHFSFMYLFIQACLPLIRDFCREKSNLISPKKWKAYQLCREYRNISKDLVSVWLLVQREHYHSLSWCRVCISFIHLTFIKPSDSCYQKIKPTCVNNGKHITWRIKTTFSAIWYTEMLATEKLYLDSVIKVLLNIKSS